MEIAARQETWLRWGKTRGRPPHPYIHRFSHAWAKNLLHFSTCACHPCAGAMLIFSVSCQFYRMIPEGNLGSEQKRCLPCSSRHHQCHGWPFTIDIPLLAFFRPGLCPNVPHSAAVSCPRRQSTLGSGIPLTRLSWAEARVKIAGMTLTIKLDGNWSSFQLANSAPPLSVTDSTIAPSARMFFQQLLT